MSVSTREELPLDYYSADDAPQFDPGRPSHAKDADLTIYWPWVRPCWEEDRQFPASPETRTTP